MLRSRKVRGIKEVLVFPYKHPSLSTSSTTVTLKHTSTYQFSDVGLHSVGVLQSIVLGTGEIPASRNHKGQQLLTLSITGEITEPML